MIALPRLSFWSISLIAPVVCLAGAQRCEARAAPAAALVADKATPNAPRSDAAMALQPPQPPAGTTDEAGPDDTIIVTAPRWGKADIASETELDEDRIAAYGANTIGELVEEITPLIGKSRDTPILLVNGRRIGSSTEITGYPPEALNRLAILAPEAAARYGYAAGQRVVNLELKKSFASTDADAGFGMPFAGGRTSSQLSATRSIIDGDTRWNVQLRGNTDTPLLKSERDIPVRADVAAILPLLEAAEGRSIDPNRFETLAAKTRSLNLNIGVVRPVGDFFLSLNANAGVNRSTQRTGLPIASIMLPSAAGNEIRYRLVGERALESRQRSTNVGASASLSGAIAGWQTSFSASWSESRNSNANDTGFDSSDLQDRVDAGDPSFDPSGPWPFLPLLTDRNRSSSQTIGATFNASRSVFKLPAGEATTNITVNASQSRSRFRASAAATGAVSRDRFASHHLDGRWSFTLPVANRALGILAPLGDLGVDLSMEVGKARQTAARYKWDAGVRWSPLPFFDFRGAFGHENVEPLFEQLYGPRIEVITRLFDFARQEYVQPISVFGGNPDLAGGRIRTLSANAMIRPFKGDLATFNIEYRRRVAQGGIASLPTLTPDIEAIFPDRFVRDAGGRLISIDARPINISNDRTETLTSGFTLLYTARRKAPDGAPPPPADQRPWTFSLSVVHSWQLASELVIRPELPVLDRLRDSGQPRHNVTLNLVVGRRGMGASLNGNWNGAARVRSGGEAGGAEFRYPASMQFNLGLFAEPEHWLRAREDSYWASNLRLSFDIQNLFGGYRRVIVVGGATPRGFSRDEIDPLGRTIRLGIRKRF
ncbi:MAG: hypothetical protein HEQ22_05270 [Sphingopyxis sp.]|uniref:hypothetical protein n=1 Tax=Sphingopyxis sp. TaxID=1908224 RepID=UPI003D80E903